MPERLDVKSGYARLSRLPRSVEELAGWMADAEEARHERAAKLERSGGGLTADMQCTDTGAW